MPISFGLPSDAARGTGDETRVRNIPMDPRLTDVPAAAAFDRLTRIGALATGAPISVVTIVDAERGLVRSCGHSGEFPEDPVEVPLARSYCQHVIASREPVLIPDTMTHPITAARTRIEGAPVRAYAGAPIFAPDGEVLGAFCAVDREPHAWTERDAELLVGLAAAASSEIALHAAVAARAAAERESAYIAARLADAQRIAHTGSWELDVPTRTLRWSDEMFRLAGLPPRDGPVPLEDAYASVHPDDVAQLRVELGAHVAAGRRFTYTYRVRWPDGTVRVMRGMGEPRTDERGELTRIAGTLADVTEQVTAEATLRESEARLRLALDVAQMGVWERDVATSRVQGMVPGDSGGELVPLAFDTYDGFLALVHPEDRERVRRTHADAFEQGSDSTVEYRMTDGQGGWRFRQATARLLCGPDGRPSRVLGVTRDITERVTREETLRQAQKMEAVGQLAGGIAHDFNNLLTIIAGGVRFARDEAPVDSPIHEELGAVEDAAERAAQLTRQLLAFSRGQVLEPMVLDPNAVVRRLEPMLRRLIGEDIEIVTHAACDVGHVRADPGQLDQVLLNLAVNARDAMPKGGRLTIATSRLDVPAADARCRSGTVAPGSYVRLLVSDTGTGMDRATLAHLFEPFFTTKGPGKGTGLGLATVHGIVTQSGGFVTVTSEPGCGTTFEVTLPEVPLHEIPSQVASVRHEQHARASATVLLVEDDQHVRRLIARVLGAAGYTVLEAGSGPAALARAAEEAMSVDVIVTDMVMPEMSGREVAERYTTFNPRVKVLFISGYTDDEILRRGLLAPGMAFLGKPFTPEQCRQAVARVLSASEPARD